MQQAQAQGLLRQMLGGTADFRDGQWKAIDLVVNQRRRVLVVQRTGWGKSIVYFLATRILRDTGAGPTLLISPLLRSEEHTSELQSQSNLVCRLLLEKKKRRQPLSLQPVVRCTE